LTSLRIKELFVAPKNFHQYFPLLWILFLLKFMSIKANSSRRLNILWLWWSDKIKLIQQEEKCFYYGSTTKSLIVIVFILSKIGIFI
jgi:hypothetical protein